MSMKFAALVVFLGSLSLVSAAPSKPVDEALAANAPVVLRGKRLSEDSNADKFRWYEVRILKVYKNDTHETLQAEIRVAALSSRPGVPDGESTLYLEPYSKQRDGLWKLVGGEASTGVSHAPK
jgi:hypothetical protein